MAGGREKLALTAQKNRREIVKANLSRREMMRMGLLTASGSLVVKQGLSARWAWADGAPDGSDLTLTEVQGIDGPPSPPSVPYIQELPRLPIQQTVAANQLTAGAEGHQILRGPDGTSVVNEGTQRVPQQFFSVNPDGTLGPGPSGNFPPTHFYQLTLKQGTVRLNDPNPAFGSTTVWGFAQTPDGPPVVPGPHI
jgi:hypothetical protein